ncbi:MAG TPA: hypothetical protein VJU61_02765 [Polyangiaceae bacterium]|nr:hypothetical protein [Polyangiaceae bacterium]
MTYVNVLAATCALVLLGACKEEHGTPLLGKACVPEEIPSGPAGSGFSFHDTQLTTAKECGGDPCIVHRLDNGSDGGLLADPTVLCSEEDPIAGCVNASQLEHSVYCTCRCDGPDRNCLCPDDYACQQVLTVGPDQRSGSYCVHRGK